MRNNNTMRIEIYAAEDAADRMQYEHSEPASDSNETAAGLIPTVN